MRGRLPSGFAVVLVWHGRCSFRVFVTCQGQRSRDEPLEALVTISCLNAAADTRGARFYKALGHPPPTPPVVEALADQLALTPDARRHEISRAHDAARAALDAAGRLGLDVMTCLDADYPPLLLHITDPPVVLWIRGDRAALAMPAVAIVGARAATPAGLTVGRRLAQDLAAAGLVVVSGMARGVDGAAHTGALDAGGRSVAVLGCGADVAYPREHAGLAVRLAASGAVVSELPPGSPPLSHHFPLRNRIISGLVRAVVVIEASDRSGSLITAKSALEQGRDVLAVPGSVASGRYRGSHALIKDGARLVETVEDVLEELRWQRPVDTSRASAGGLPVPSNNSLHFSALEEKMAPGEPYSVEALAGETGLPVPALLAELAHMELAGRVARLGDGSFVRLD